MAKQASRFLTTFPVSFPLFFGIILVVFFGLRFFHLPESIGFGTDAGRDYLEVWNIVENSDITLIGPPSQYSVDGRQFFFGPAPYYIMLPALVLGNWEPLVTSYYLVVINALVFGISLFILYKALPNREKFILFPYAIFCTTTPVLVEYSRTYWNPYFMLPLSMLLLSLLVWVKEKKMGVNLALFLGFLFGIGMQLHYSFILTICFSCIYLLTYKRANLRQSGYIFLGFLIGILPLIVFELTKNFYNIQTILLVIQNWERVGGSAAGFPYYYLLSLFPFVFYVLSIVLLKLWRTRPKLVLMFLGAYTAISILLIIPVPDHGYGMAKGWNYRDLQKTAELIEADSPSNYNIVDQLTLDNRAMALRYLLTINGIEPNEYTDYTNVDVLYIYSREPLESLLKDPIYEIKSALPLTLMETEKIQEDIFLYKLEKSTK